MNTVLISGGSIDDDFALDFLKKRNPDCIIGIDRGVHFCYRNGIKPDYILGDFDSISEETMHYYENQKDISICRFPPEKDATDTQLGVEKAIALKSTSICLLGGTGGRMDHFWGNVQSLAFSLRHGVLAGMVDAQNFITLLSEDTTLKRAEQFGTYVSFFPFGDHVEGLTLTGFKYPLNNYFLTNYDTIGISNEIVEHVANIKFRQGILIMMMSKDV
jgi:thiamine pyrophosphokinase